MSLNYEFKDKAVFEKLDKEHKDNIFNVCMLMMGTDIGELTEKTLHNFVRRVQVAKLCMVEITEEIFKPYLSLSINVRTSTNKQFAKKQGRIKEREIYNALYYEIRKNS